MRRINLPNSCPTAQALRQMVRDPRQVENERRRAVWRYVTEMEGPKEAPREGDEAWLKSEWVFT